MTHHDREWTHEQKRSGWSCIHRSNEDGPCERCHPGSGLCKRCLQPFDAHQGREWKCPVFA